MAFPGASMPAESALRPMDVPTLSGKFRLQYEQAQAAWVLLYPEGMVKLNNSAAAIMTRCDGVRTVADIVADIERTYEVTGLAGDVAAFVVMARDNGWLELRA